ncbi:DUF3304 domain-containing protein [Paraburkholderia nemoris]|uniref:DUF3304 domain-containing protein n=1 Tax=Paraburkholderia nemoris TaxID=2793076 RepID=UPI001B209C1B|nr:DUF3304 domain-containing protein [Paraburkholderia nemoris]CAE6792332.1 hypothetical protein LMG22931_05014 [Paraburkholderia nemoris]
MKLKTFIRVAGFGGLGLLALNVISGCAKEPYELAIVGYDYTDRAIAEFSVDGAWAGNLELSSPTNGGGSSVCCVTLKRTIQPPFWVTVQYRKDALESYPPRKVIEPAGGYIKTKVEVKGPIPSDAAYLEIHFFPDGHLEAAVSGEDGPSSPRLKLERRLPYVR